MAGSFSGNLLGTFSGRGADVSPMQFIQEMRQRAIQAEQQKKMQQQQMQQSFTMALMAKKQQEAEMAQQGQQFQAQQQQRIAEKNMAAEQFRAEQDRIREATRAQDELRRLSEGRQAAELNQRQAEYEGTRALQRTADDRRALGRNVQTATVRGLEQRFQQFAAIPGFEPTQALDAIESSAIEETKTIDDPEAQAMAVAEVRQWRADKESQLGRRESLGSMIDERKARADDRAEGRRLQGERDRAAAAQRKNKPIEDEMDDLRKERSQFSKIAVLYKGSPEGDNAAEEVKRIDALLVELKGKLAPVE